MTLDIKHVKEKIANIESQRNIVQKELSELQGRMNLLNPQFLMLSGELKANQEILEMLENIK